MSEPMNHRVNDRLHHALRVEVDVTPRWFEPGRLFDADHLAVVTAFHEGAGDLRPLLVDFQVGLSGVRLVLAVPAGVSTDAIEDARGKLAQVLDALDLVSPRRRAVTEHRAGLRYKSLQAARGPREVSEGAQPPAEAVATPPRGSNGAPGDPNPGVAVEA